MHPIELYDPHFSKQTASSTSLITFSRKVAVQWAHFTLDQDLSFLDFNFDFSHVFFRKFIVCHFLKIYFPPYWYNLLFLYRNYANYNS